MSSTREARAVEIKVSVDVAERFGIGAELVHLLSDESGHLVEHSQQIGRDVGHGRHRGRRVAEVLCVESDAGAGADG